MTRKIFLKYGSIFFLPYLLCLVCFAQQQKIDSLRRQLSSLNTKDTSLVNCLNELSAAYLTINKDSTQFFASVAMLESERGNFAKGKALAYYNLASNELYFGTFPLAEKYLKMSISFSDTKDELQLVKSYTWLGVAQWAQSKFDSAIETYKKAEHLCLITGDKFTLGDVYVSMSALESQRGHYKNSIEYSMKGLILWKEPGTFNPRGTAAISFIHNAVGDYQTSLNYYRETVKYMKSIGIEYNRSLYTFMGETYFQAKQYDSAVFCYQFIQYNNNKNRPSPHWLEDIRLESWINSRMAEIYIAREKYDTALLKLNGALIEFEKISDRNQVMWVLVRLMTAYNLNKEYGAALRSAYKLLQIATETGARQHVRDANFILYKIFDHQQKNDSAYHYLKQYSITKEIIDADQTEQRLSLFKSLIDAEKTKATFDRLNQEKELQQLQLNQVSIQRYFLGIGSLLLLVIGVIGFRNISLKQKSETNQLEIVQNELRLQKLESEATKANLQQKAAELEMQALRAQMNPHFIFNSLNSINRFILKNDRTQASEYLTKFSKLVRLILQNSQATLISLESELEGLALYLELEALRFEQRFSYKIHISKDLEISELKVPPLFIQPYAENAIWHGLMHKEEKGQLDIDVTQENKHLVLRIIDNGIGRKQSAALGSKSATRHKSLGLKITADRIATINSSTKNEAPITIHDLVNADGSAAGTEVTIRIPIAYD